MGRSHAFGCITLCGHSILLEESDAPVRSRRARRWGRRDEPRRSPAARSASTAGTLRPESRSVRRGLRKARGFRPVVEIDGDIGEDGVVAARLAIDLRPRDRPSCCIGRRESGLGKGAGVRRLVASGRYRRDRAEIGVEWQGNAAAEPGAASCTGEESATGSAKSRRNIPKSRRIALLPGPKRGELDQVDRDDIAGLVTAHDDRAAGWVAAAVKWLFLRKNDSFYVDRDQKRGGNLLTTSIVGVDPPSCRHLDTLKFLVVGRIIRTSCTTEDFNSVVVSSH
jgi:hypothetical protein